MSLVIIMLAIISISIAHISFTILRSLLRVSKFIFTCLVGFFIISYLINPNLTNDAGEYIILIFIKIVDIISAIAGNIQP